MVQIILFLAEECLCTSEVCPHGIQTFNENSLHNLQQRIIAVLSKAVKTGKLNANPFYKLEKVDYFAKPKGTHKQFLTPEEL